eukprot:TRINITY_DN1594_c0_g1_i1.p1 TRINITY_DN1594_c0_g1~~TRINITY_DN1594_c0_g1_i1.p1  ORF type:complete len:103 (-),score=21.16 TRINITY_DN1594_c0_g1_i1:214-522(-)
MCIRDRPQGAGFSSLDQVVALFSSRPIMFAGWSHYICFDLLAGLWVTQDAQVSGVPHAVVVCLLPVLLMAGPAGLFAYLVLRACLAGPSAAQSTKAKVIKEF